MALIIYLIPIWWLIGLKPIILQLTILVISLNYFLNYGIKFNLISMMLLLYSNIYIASILYNLPEMPFGRAVGSFANCSLWISGGLIIIYINNLYSFKKVFTISKSLIYILLISSY